MRPMTAEWIANAERDFAVAFRYPGETADSNAAVETRRRCRGFRSAARRSLDLA